MTRHQGPDPHRRQRRLARCFATAAATVAAAAVVYAAQALSWQGAQEGGSGIETAPPGEVEETLRELGVRAERLESAVEGKAELRRKAVEGLARAWAVGSVVAAHNPGLTPAERLRIGRTVLGYSRTRGLDPGLVTSIIIVESGGRVEARSPKGARGLMQVMPRWAGPGEDLYDIETNIRLGTAILADNIGRWGFKRGVQAYFWGTGKPDGRYITKVLEVMEGLGPATG